MNHKRFATVCVIAAMAVGRVQPVYADSLGAGLVGGVSATAAINHGDGVKVYEAVYGAGHDAVPPDTANPLPLILPAVEMLRDFGDAAAADRIQRAVEAVLVDGAVRTRDIGGTATTTEFAEAVAARL